jgi:hypothetical protein
MALMMEAVSTSETSKSFCETTWSSIPKHSHHHIPHRKNPEFSLTAVRQYVMERDCRFGGYVTFV